MRTVLMSCAVALLISVAACGSDETAGSTTEKSTPRALAAVLVEKLDKTTKAEASEGIDYYGDGAVGATVHLAPETQVSLVVGDDLPHELTSCKAKADLRDACVEIGDAVLTWTKEEPEEDFGEINVAVPKGKGWALATQTGTFVTADPRTLDLDVSVDDMLALARDKRVGLTTTPATIAAGDKVPNWHGPNKNPVYDDA
ncbi:MAG: hypothetical protein ABWY58_06285 [Aeromicrobium sp.]